MNHMLIDLIIKHQDLTTVTKYTVTVSAEYVSNAPFEKEDYYGMRFTAMTPFLGKNAQGVIESNLVIVTEPSVEGVLNAISKALYLKQTQFPFTVTPAHLL